MHHDWLHLSSFSFIQVSGLEVICAPDLPPFTCRSQLHNILSVTDDNNTIATKLVNAISPTDKSTKFPMAGKLGAVQISFMWLYFN
jgi:hypothetical protein